MAFKDTMAWARGGIRAIIAPKALPTSTELAPFVNIGAISTGISLGIAPRGSTDDRRHGRHAACSDSLPLCKEERERAQASGARRVASCYLKCPDTCELCRRRRGTCHIARLSSPHAYIMLLQRGACHPRQPVTRHSMSLWALTVPPSLAVAGHGVTTSCCTASVVTRPWALRRLCSQIVRYRPSVCSGLASPKTMLAVLAPFCDGRCAGRSSGSWHRLAGLVFRHVSQTPVCCCVGAGGAQRCAPAAPAGWRVRVRTGRFPIGHPL